MKICNWIAIAAISGTGSLAAQSAENFEFGITLGDPLAPHSYIDSWVIGAQTQSRFTTPEGGILLHAGAIETARGAFDGGISLSGKPISFILGSDSGSNPNTGTFDVWRDGDYWNSSAVTPVFRINTAANTAAFNSLDVSISNGTLKIAGSDVLTQATSAAVLAGQGFVTGTSLTGTLSAYVPKRSSATGSLALGSSQATGIHSLGAGLANATGAYSYASGGSNVTASGSYSMANGYLVTASGDYSTASGINAVASGSYSFAKGSGANATGANSAAFGTYSYAKGDYSFTSGSDIYADSLNETVLGKSGKRSLSPGGSYWYDLDGLFRIANGEYSSARSDALTVLKNGQTTVGNKYWRIAVAQNPSAALSNPSSLIDSEGEALVVDGHTRLRGKVVIEQAQGDISMGIYGGGGGAEAIIHGVIAVSAASGSPNYNGSLVIDGRTISANDLQFQDGSLDSGTFAENGTALALTYVGDTGVLSNGKRITLTAAGIGGVAIAIRPAE
ncbi:hypothetical protein [Luteolibacter sp. Populi]|uniref:hypothetical protein n=1 Tax=Luteolibacter sp. Populi TaxID=3230487 RepID=UPI0034678F42